MDQWNDQSKTQFKKAVHDLSTEQAEKLLMLLFSMERMEKLGRTPKE